MGVSEVAQSAKQSAIQEGKQVAQQEAKQAANQAANETKNSMLSDGLDKARGEMSKDTHLWEGMDAPEGAKVGDKVAPGKQVGKDGKIENTATREGLEAAVNIASIVAGGAPAAGKGAAASAGKEAGKQVAKEAGKEAAKEAGKEAAKEAGKEAAKEASKSAAKGFGAGNSGALTGMPGGGGSGGGMGMPGGNPMQGMMEIPGAKEAVGKVMGEIDTMAGKAADDLEKVPGVKKSAEDNKEGFKAVNEAFNAYGAATSGDYQEAIKELKKAKKNAGKFVGKKMARMAIAAILPLLFLIIIIVILIGPFVGGFLELTDFGVAGSIAPFVEYGTPNAWLAVIGADGSNSEAAKAVIGEVPGYDDFPLARKAIVVSAALAIGTKYYEGARPTSAILGGISNGVDSGGFLEWLIWNVTGSDPGYLPGSSLASNPNFNSITQDELLPGDIGANGDDIGIYMGNNEWIIVDSSQGVIRTQYNGFTSFYRHVALGGASGGGGSNLPDIDPGESAEVRDRVLTIAKQLSDMHIPYNVHYPDNQAKSLDINMNNFFKPITDDALSFLGKDTKATNRFGGMDCCSFVGYVYSLAINEAKYFGMCGYINANAAPAPGFAEVSFDNAQPGDMIKFINDKGNGSHMAILISKESNGIKVYEEGGWGTRYYNYDATTNMISPATPADVQPAGTNWIKSYRGASVYTYGYNSYTYKYYRYTAGITNPDSPSTYDPNKPVSKNCSEMISALYPDGVPSSQAGLHSYEVLTEVPITKKDGTKSTTKIYLHKLIANDVVKALQAAQDEGFIVYQVQSSRDWKRCISETGGSTCGLTMSQHCYGLAVDINIAENPFTTAPHDTSSPYAITHNTALYKTFMSLGWGWGGDWKQNRKDYMHFSYMGS